MADKTTTATATAADPSSHFINFTEDFRRAKRNSLVWSAITAFVAYAPNWSAEATVFGMKMGYPQAGLTFILWLAAAFFGLSFIRANVPLKTLNSEAARESEAVWHDIKETLSGWQARLSDKDAAINNLFETSRSFKEIQDRIEQAISDLPVDFKNRADGSFTDQLAKFSTPAWDDPNGTQFYLHVNAYWSDWRTEWVEFVREASQWTLDQFKEHGPTYDRTRTDYLAADLTTVTAIKQLEESLSRFREAISEAERAWHFSLDIFATYAVFFVATFGMVTRLFVPGYLDTAIIRVFG